MTSFDDLKVQNYEFELQGPGGQSLLVTLRALTPDEVIQINRESQRPEPPIKDFQKVDGQPRPIYGYEDAGYRANLEEWIANTRRMLIARALVTPDIPGETVQEKADALKEIAAWALAGLHQAVEMLLGGADERVTMRKFQQERVDA